MKPIFIKSIPYQKHVAFNNYTVIIKEGISLWMHFLNVRWGFYTAVQTIFYGTPKDNDLTGITFKYPSGHLCIKKWVKPQSW